MIEKVLDFLVLGNSDGPPCEDCNEPTDTIQMQSPGHELDGLEAYYCFVCTQEAKK